MITATAVRTIDRGNVAATGSFSIKATGKAFRILSDGLYSDKPLAIIRELSCNAYDAHVSAKKAHVPFEVHLPNVLEPWFSVKDYGTGLSDEQVMKLYTTYFESTKTESNDFIGALGLGSKSPFSYVDSFTVQSRYNGVLRTYTAYISEDGVPSISKMAEMPTTEVNGLEVSMPVKSSDFSIFKERAERVLKRFNPLPVVTGAKATIVPPKYVLEGSCWKVREYRGYGTGDSGLIALQGSVAYPIDKNAISEHLNGTQRVLLGMHIDLVFDMGELEVAASREALSYDKRTIENIKKRLQVVIDEMAPHYQKAFDGCKTLWEAKLTFSRTLGSSSYEIKHLLYDKLEYDGQKINSSYLEVDLTPVQGALIDVLDYRAIRRQKLKYDWTKKGSFDVTEDLQVFIDDGTLKHISRRLKHHFTTENIHRRAVVVQCDKGSVPVVLTLLGSPPASNVKMIHDLEEPPKENVVRERRKSDLKKLYEYDPHYDRWNETMHDVTSGGIYVHLSSWVPQRGGHSYYTFNKLVTLAKTLELIDQPIFGIPATYKKVPEQNAGWTSVFDVIEPKVKALLADRKLPKQVASLVELQNHERCDVIKVLLKAQEKGLSIKRKNTPFGQLWQSFLKLMAAIGDQKRIDAIQDIALLLNLQVKSDTPVVTLDPVIDALDPDNNYPLFSLVWRRSDCVKQWVDYINLVDAKRS